MALPRPVGPRAFIADLRAFFGNRSKPQLVAATLAILLPATIIWGFVVDSDTNTAPPPRITYVENWRADRTDAEIKEGQRQDQLRREAIAAERQRQFKALENRFGI